MTVTIATAISARLEARFAVELAEVEEAQLVRRCADVEELLTVIESGGADVAAISPDFPGASGGLVAEIALRGARVLAVLSPTSGVDARQSEAWGVVHTHTVGSGRLAEVVAALTSVRVPAPGSAAVQEAGDAPPLIPPTEAAEPEAEPPPQGGDTQEGGRVVAIWGPEGAPGRTTVAAHLAHVLSGGGSCLLIDADTRAPACAPVLGLVDEAPGVLAAARLIDAGTFNTAQLAGLVARVEEGFDVLTGIANPGRWHELGRYHLEQLVGQVRNDYDWIVVDVASDLAMDEELAYDTLAPARNAATVTALENADVVVALAAADPVSLQRFVVTWPELTALHPEPVVVLSKARKRAVGGDPASVAGAALDRFVGAAPTLEIPDARDALDDALLTAKLLTATDADGGFAQAIRELAAAVGWTAGEAAPTPRRRWWSRRRQASA